MAQKRQHLPNGLEAGPTPSKMPAPATQSPSAGRLLFQDNKIKLLEAELENTKKRANEYRKELVTLQNTHSEDLKKFESLLQFQEAERIKEVIPAETVTAVDEPGPSTAAAAAEASPEIFPLDDPKFKSQTLLMNILVRTASKSSSSRRIFRKYDKYLVQEDTNLPDCFEAEEMHTRFQEILHMSNREPLRSNDFGPYKIPHRPELKAMRPLESEDISMRVPIWMSLNAEQGALLYYPNNNRNGKPRVMTEAKTAPTVVPQPVFQKTTRETDISYKLLNFFS